MTGLHAALPFTLQSSASLKLGRIYGFFFDMPANKGKYLEPSLTNNEKYWCGFLFLVRCFTFDGVSVLSVHWKWGGAWGRSSQEKM